MGNSPKVYRVAVIPGDGIGPSVVKATLEILDRAAQAHGFSLDFSLHEGGAGHFLKHGEPISEETIEACARAHAVIKGPVGLPQARRPDGTEGGLLGGTFRFIWNLYANVRPIRLWPGVGSPLKGVRPGEINYTIVRENTEGLYASRNSGVVREEAAVDSLLITRKGTKRVIEFAFHLARGRGEAPLDGKKRVTCVDKANVLRSMAFFREIFYQVAQDFTEIEADTLHADAAAQALVLEPKRFHVLVMENLLGDILSDLGGATVGGLGMCPSGNIGDKNALFEPLHGSAPDLADNNKANPLATILSGAMMLEWLGEKEAARAIEKAVERALTQRLITVEPQGTVAPGTREAASIIRDLLE